MRCLILGFAFGIGLVQQQASLWGWPELIMLACLAGLIALITLGSNLIRLSLLRHASMLMIGGCIGWIWASSVAMVGLSQRLAPEIEGQDITVVGVISSLPSQVEYGQRFQFLVERVLTPNINPEQIPKKILLNLYTTHFQQPTPPTPTLQPGERWQFKVRLRRPHGLANPHGFDYEVWLLEHGLGATGSVRNDAQNHRITPFVFSFNNAIEWARGKLRERILTALPEQPYAPVIVALVIGEQNAITQNDWKIFARTGVSHLIAISGLHVTLLSGLFASVMFYLWRKSFFTRYQLPLILPAQKVAALSGVLMALTYVALAGFGVPAQRTLLMVSVAALACWFDRIASVTNVLCLALGVVLLVDPWAVLAPGFWLSFSAVGLLFYVSLGRRELNNVERKNLVLAPSSAKTTLLEKARQQLHQASLAQYAITLGLVPLTMLLFNQVSLVSPLANAVAIPIVSFLITPFSLIGSVLPAPLDSWILNAANFILQQLIVLLSWLSEFSWAIWQAPRPEWWMFICALIGTAWCLAPQGWPLRWAGLLAWLPLCLNTSVYPSVHEFKVTAFDVGQGMALLIETEHHRLLYDTGPLYSVQSDAGSSVIYPYLKMRGIDQLDGLMISHSDTDHSGGALSLMQQLDVKWVSSSLASDSTIVQAATKHTACLAGQSWQWDGVQFEILYPDSAAYRNEKRNEKPNTKSCTLKISNGKYSILLAGDIEAAQEKKLVKQSPNKLASSVLLVPHHGSGTSSSVEFLRATQPQIAIFQLGYQNRYRHPKSTVWQRYADFDITRLRTDQAGAITLHFGEQISVEKFRTTHARYWYPVPDID